MANPFTSAQAPQAMQALPPDLAVQQAQLARQQQMAELLRKQALQSDGGTEMVSGWAVKKSPMEGVSKLAQALLGGYMQKDADTKQADLARQSSQQLVDGLNKYQSLMQGAPAETFDLPSDQAGPVGTAPAVPGNKQAALASLLQSGNPMLQQLGVKQMLAKQESPFNKVDPKDFTQDSVAKFATSGNYADLVPARKMEVAPSGVVYNPFAAKEGTVFNDPNKLMSIGTDGQPAVNQTLVGVKKDIAKSGAPNVQVKTDVKTGESLAGQVGPMMKDSTAIAESAVKQVDAAQRVVQAVDSGKVIAGPGASARVKLDQIGQLLGVGGQDQEERIANTRQAIRGFAELTLQGRQQMRGQGAITESESKLAEKAMSGNIDDLTPAEIKQLAKASERSARFNYGEHQRKLQVMQSNPALQAIAPFYQGPAMPPELKASPAPTTPASNGGIKFLGFE